MDPENVSPDCADSAHELRAVLPPELDTLSDEPFVPVDLDAFERWAATGEGDPWSHGM